MKKKNHMRTVCIMDPGVRIDPEYWIYKSGLEGNHFCEIIDAIRSKSIEEGLFGGQVWSGLCNFPNFLHSETRKWWGDLYRELYLENQVAGFWNDMNESALFNTENRTFPDNVVFSTDINDEVLHRHAHNIYGMEMVRATFEGLKRLKPDERAFVLTRSGFSGIQRFAWSWSGDNISSWNTSSWNSMSSGLVMLLNMNISGQAGCGADIGGFFENSTPKLFSRWIQMACLHYFCRTHTAVKTNDQEPWSFGIETEKISTAYIRLRYQLMPFVYTQMQQACQKGTAYLKPLFFVYPCCGKAYEQKWEET